VTGAGARPALFYVLLRNFSLLFAVKFTAPPTILLRKPGKPNFQ